MTPNPGSFKERMEKAYETYWINAPIHAGDHAYKAGVAWALNEAAKVADEGPEAVVHKLVVGNNEYDVQIRLNSKSIATAIRQLAKEIEQDEA